MANDEADTIRPPPDEIPPPPSVPRDVMHALDPSGAIVLNIAKRLEVLPDILAIVSKSAANVNLVAKQIESLGTAFDHLSRDIRTLTKRVAGTEARLNAAEGRLLNLESRLAELERASRA